MPEKVRNTNMTYIIGLAVELYVILELFQLQMIIWSWKNSSMTYSSTAEPIIYVVLVFLNFSGMEKYLHATHIKIWVV